MGQKVIHPESSANLHKWLNQVKINLNKAWITERKVLNINIIMIKVIFEVLTQFNLEFLNGSKTETSQFFGKPFQMIKPSKNKHE